MHFVSTFIISVSIMFFIIILLYRIIDFIKRFSGDSPNYYLDLDFEYSSGVLGFIIGFLLFFSCLYYFDSIFALLLGIVLFFIFFIGFGMCGGFSILLSMLLNKLILWAFEKKHNTKAFFSKYNEWEFSAFINFIFYSGKAIIENNNIHDITIYIRLLENDIILLTFTSDENDNIQEQRQYQCSNHIEDKDYDVFFNALGAEIEKSNKKTIRRLHFSFYTSNICNHAISLVKFPT